MEPWLTESSSFTTRPTEMPTYILHKNHSLRTTVGFTCCLSILGSILIILSYLLFRGLRTNSRLILVHLSFADLGVALSNLFGIISHFDHHYSPNSTSLNPDLVNHVCKAQAFVAHFSTISSVLWTMLLAAYMYSVITRLNGLTPSNTKGFKRFMIAAYVFCYGMASSVTVWLLRTNRLGFAPMDTSGWCAMKPTKELDYLAYIFGYDLWIVMTLFFTLVIYFSLYLFVKQEEAISGEFQEHIQNVDYKFMLIPLAFILLRIWSLLLELIFFYFQYPIANFPGPLHRILKYLAGIGDSGQGAVNAILFVMFTHNVRRRLFCCWYCLRRRRNVSNQHFSEGSSDDDGTQMPQTSPLHINHSKWQKEGNTYKFPVSIATTTTLSTSPSLCNNSHSPLSDYMNFASPSNDR